MKFNVSLQLLIDIDDIGKLTSFVGEHIQFKDIIDFDVTRESSDDEDNKEEGAEEKS